MHIEQTTEIARAPRDVFEFVLDFENAPQWQSGVISSEKVTPGPIRVGSRFAESVKLAGRRVRAICEVTALRPDEHLEFSGKGGAVEYRCRVRFAPVASGTRVEAAMDVRLNGLWRLLRPLIGGELRRETAREFATLKRVLESPSAPAAEAKHLGLA